MNNKTITIAYMIKILNVCFSSAKCSSNCEFHEYSKCILIRWRSWYIEPTFGKISSLFDKATCHSDEFTGVCNYCKIRNKVLCRLSILQKALSKNRYMKVNSGSI